MTAITSPIRTTPSSLPHTNMPKSEEKRHAGYAVCCPRPYTPIWAVPFTLIDHLMIFNQTSNQLYRTDIAFTPRPIPGGLPEPTRIAYAPKGLICWVNGGRGMIMGQSKCDYYVTMEQQTVTVRWDNNMENIPLLEPYRNSSKRIAANGTMFVCGEHAFRFLPTDWKGSCYLAYIVPAMRLVRYRLTGQSDIFGSHEMLPPLDNGSSQPSCHSMEPQWPWTRSGKWLPSWKRLQTTLLEPYLRLIWNLTPLEELLCRIEWPWISY